MLPNDPMERSSSSSQFTKCDNDVEDQDAKQPHPHPQPHQDAIKGNMEDRNEYLVDVNAVAAVMTTIECLQPDQNDATKEGNKSPFHKQQPLPPPYLSPKSSTPSQGVSVENSNNFDRIRSCTGHRRRRRSRSSSRRHALLTSGNINHSSHRRRLRSTSNGNILQTTTPTAAAIVPETATAKLSSPLAFDLGSAHDNVVVSSTSWEYTEHTYHSSMDEDQLLEYQDFGGDSAEDEENDDEGVDNEEEDGSVASSSVGCWNSDNGILYYSESERTKHDRRHSLLRNHPSRTNNSRMSLSAHTLSSAFTLSDLSSVVTVSSLEDDDEVENDNDEDGVGALITVDGVGILTLASAVQQRTTSFPGCVSEPSPKRKNQIRAIPKMQDTINDLCSLNSTDQKLRQFERMVEIHQLREAFSYRNQHRQTHPTDSDSTTNINGDDYGGSFVEEEEEIEIEEEIVDEFEESEEAFDPDDREVHQLARRVHKSMVVTTALHLQHQNPHGSRLTRTGCGEGILDYDVLHSRRRYSFDAADNGKEEGFPDDLVAAKQYLAQLSFFQNHDHSRNNLLSQAHMRRPSNDGVAAQLNSSSDDYTEVLVESSEDGNSLGD